MMGIWWNNINSGISSNTIVFLKQHAFHKVFPIYAQPQNKRISDPIRRTNPRMQVRQLEEGLEGMFLEYKYMNNPIKTWRDPLKLPHQWLIINNMPSTHSSPTPKKEFTEVITDSNLTSTPTPHSHEFYSILTETSLLDTETPISPIPHADFIKYYDQMFPTLEWYKNYMDRRLGIWEHDLQVKYFDYLYCHQQATTNSIKILHNQVQKLLEEANQLQKRKHSLHQEINHHLHTITQPKLCQCLYNPYKVQPWPPIPTVWPTQPIPSASWPTLHSNPNPKKWTVLHCFQCNSLTHIK